MNTFSRRRFLALAGAGVVAVAGGGAFTIHQLIGNGTANTLTFSAVTGLPAKPFPSYASYMISGQVNPTNGTGTITKAVYAGPPDKITSIPLLTRTVRVTGVQQQGSAWRIRGVVSDQTQIQAGEETSFDILLDSSRNLAQSSFFGSPIQLEIQKLSVS
ncbi:MAG TPA: twin-arginine translocation signal domain-containing protein [Ktedonobacteraceae bacterium]|nr:twin-arginine translocation signal domain-containing protein [Ktedonobacteraceae bacterium]